MTSAIKYYYINYKCYFCEKDFANSRNLRRHFEEIENQNFPPTSRKRYNTKTGKFLILANSKTRNGVINTYGCISCNYHCLNLGDLANHMEDKHLPPERVEFKKNFIKISDAVKWVLSTGKVVEDSVYEFGKRALVDHPSHSFILDVDDPTYLQNGVFTEEELEEIRNEQSEPSTKLPDNFKQYLNQFYCSTTQEIRSQLNKRRNWEMSYDINKHHDLDWIKNTIYNLVREYECDSLSRDHLELWYSIHVWSFIDKLFDDVKNLEVSRSEPGSIASSVRKNQDRVIGSLSPLVRKATGYKCDFIIRETYATEKEKLEHSVGEIAKFYDKHGTKSLMENHLKLPKCLKDMLDLLAERYPDYLRKHKVFGFLHSGLSIMLLTASKPKGVITRITRGVELSIPAEVDEFGSKVLPVLVQVFRVKEAILNLKDTITINENENTKVYDNEGDWLETCLEPKSAPFIPVTSKSSERQKK